MDDEDYEGTDTTVRLRTVLDADARLIDMDGSEWVMVPHTEQNRYGTTDVTLESNYRSLLRNFEGNPDVEAGDYGVLFNVDTTDESIIEAYNGLLSYPIYDESDESELRMERENEAWEDWGRDDLRRAITSRFTGEDTDFFPAELISDDNLDALFYEWWRHGNIEWIHEGDGGAYLNMEKMLADQERDLGEEQLREEIGAAFFSEQAWHAKQRLTQIVGLSEWTTDEQLMLLIRVLYDLGYQPRNAIGIDDDRQLATLEQEPPVPGLVAMFDADPNAEAWYVYLAERWIALSSLRDEAASTFSEGPEAFMAFLESAQPFLSEDPGEVVDVVAVAESRGLIGVEPTDAYIAAS